MQSLMTPLSISKQKIQYSFIFFALSLISGIAFPQAGTWSTFAYYYWTPGGGPACGVPLHMTGYGTPSSMTFFIHEPVAAGQSNFTWHIADQLGLLAEGSRQGFSGTGGTNDSGATFALPRIPVGDLSFLLSGTVLAQVGTNNSCQTAVYFRADDGGEPRVQLLFKSQEYKIALRDAPSQYLQRSSTAVVGQDSVITDIDVNSADDIWYPSVYLEYTDFYINNQSEGFGYATQGQNQLLIAANPSTRQNGGGQALYRLTSAGDGSFYLGDVYTPPYQQYVPSQLQGSNLVLTSHIGSNNNVVTYDLAASDGTQNFVFISQ